MKKYNFERCKVIAIVLLMTMLLFSGNIIASESKQMSVEIFDKDGSEIALTKAEVLFLSDELHDVSMITAHIKEGVMGNTNIFIYFLHNGKWRNCACGINGNIPIAQRIYYILKDEI